MFIFQDSAKFVLDLYEHYSDLLAFAKLQILKLFRSGNRRAAADQPADEGLEFECGFGAESDRECQLQESINPRARPHRVAAQTIR